jgi:hypothetical protein
MRCTLLLIITGGASGGGDGDDVASADGAHNTRSTPVPR